jgi:hypothetical protein
VLKIQYLLVWLRKHMKPCGPLCQRCNRLKFLLTSGIFCGYTTPEICATDWWAQDCARCSQNRLLATWPDSTANLVVWTVTRFIHPEKTKWEFRFTSA